MIRDNKIEVFTGINDTPTAPSATEGCNGSYLIDRFNQVVDDVSLFFDDANSNPYGAYLQVWVDLDAGNDTNSGLSDTAPVRTIAKAIEVMNQYTTGMYDRDIRIKSANPINILQNHFDLRALQGGWFISGQWENSFLGVCLRPWPNQSLTIFYNSAVSGWFGDQGRAWVLPPLDGTKILFRSVNFVSNGYPFPIFGNQILFSYCTFEALSGSFDSCVWIQNCSISNLLTNCTLKDSSNGGIWAAAIFYSCNIPFIQIDALISSNLSLEIAAFNSSIIGLLRVTTNALATFANNNLANYFSTFDWSDIRWEVGGSKGYAAFPYKPMVATAYHDKNNNQLLADRQPAIPNATTGTEINTINAILTALRNHGLINP